MGTTSFNAASSASEKGRQWKHVKQSLGQDAVSFNAADSASGQGRQWRLVKRQYLFYVVVMM
eukprot:5938912-Karenia_brevis.AAC.1